MQLSLFENAVLKGVAQTGTTSGTYQVFADNLGLSITDLQEKVFRGKDGLRLRWQHKVRSVQNLLKNKGLIVRGNKRGNWSLTDKGRSKLTFSPLNQVRAYFHTSNGLAFWGDSSVLPDMFINEVNLIITSPPYFGHKREYGNSEPLRDYISSMVAMIEAWLPMLKSDGSLVLNLGEVTQDGYLSSYKHRLLIALEDRLGLKLVQTFQWVNINKPPSGYWVTRQKRNCVQQTEEFFWLCLNTKTVKANNQNILVDYSEGVKKQISSSVRKNGIARKRPSGHSANDATFYKDNGGAIPSNVLYATHEPAKSAYSQYCKENDLPRHPAMFPESLPKFFIDYLTDSGDMIFDPFSGSGVSPLAAEKSDRNWISGELVEEYVLGHYGRLKVNGIKGKLL